MMNSFPPLWANPAAGPEKYRLSARAVLAAVAERRPTKRILTLGGPRLTGDFVAEAAVFEPILTLAPQLPGRQCAPNAPRWARLGELE